MSEEQAPVEEIGMDDEAADGLEEPPESSEQRVNLDQLLITKRIEYRGVVVAVTESPMEEGAKRLHIVDPAAATEHVIPLSKDYAREIGESLLLTQGIKPATPAEAAALTAAAEAAKQEG